MNTKQVALDILGEKRLESLKQWYSDIIHSKYRYLVFMTSRCYNIAIILEQITEIKMVDTVEKEILTDSSFFIHCDELSHFFKQNGYFPSIILCNDIIAHGQSLNSFIKSLQLQFYKLLPDIEKNIIDKQLLHSIQINVYARISKTLLLNNKYEMKLKKQCVLSPREFHKLSYLLSSLILRLNISTNTYIFSELINNEQYEKIHKTDAIYTTYQNITQYTWIEFIGQDNEKRE